MNIFLWIIDVNCNICKVKKHIKPLKKTHKDFTTSRPCSHLPYPSQNKTSLVYE
jgi:hypothetical protein